MNSFYFVVSLVFALTVLSGGAATVLSAVDSGGNQTRKALIQKLAYIALLGAGTIVALLNRLQT